EIAPEPAIACAWAGALTAIVSDETDAATESSQRKRASRITSLRDWAGRHGARGRSRTIESARIWWYTNPGAIPRMMKPRHHPRGHVERRYARPPARRTTVMRRRRAHMLGCLLSELDDPPNA